MTKNEKILYEAEYEKALNNLKSRISRATKKGYTFSDNVIPKRPKSISPKSIERLNNIRGDVLYKKSTNSVKTSAKSSVAHPRKKNIDKARKQTSKKGTYTDPEIRKTLETKDRNDWKKTEQTNEYADAILTVQRLKEMISETNNKLAARKLTSLLEENLTNDKRDRTLQRISSANEDVISEAQTVLTYLGRLEKGTVAFNNLHFLITGRPLSAEESADANDIYDTDFEEPNVNVDEEGYIVVDQSEDNPWD